MIRCTGIAILTLFFLGCATKYQELGTSGSSGYYQVKKTDNEYLVGFKGNQHTLYETVKDYALMRAAEIAVQLDYGYFAVLGKEDKSETKIKDLGSTTYSDGKIKEKGDDLKYSGSSRTYHNQIEETYAGIELDVRYFENEPEGRYLEVHRAESTLNELRAKYTDD